MPTLRRKCVTKPLGGFWSPRGKDGVSAWKRNSIDARLLYGADKRRVYKPKIVKSIDPNDLVELTSGLVDTVQVESEIRLISNNRVASATENTFPRMLTQRYERPHPGPHLEYNTPESPQRRRLAEMFDPRTSSRSRSQTLSTPTTLVPPVITKHIDPLRREMCRVLGPASCAACIENTDKNMCRRLEHHALPRLEPSLIALVAPRLCTSLGTPSTEYHRRKAPEEAFAYDQFVSRYIRRDKRYCSWAGAPFNTMMSDLRPLSSKNMTYEEEYEIGGVNQTPQSGSVFSPINS